MKQKNINRLTAANTTVSFCEATAADTAGITAFAPLIVVIKGKIVIVKSFNILGNKPTKGVTLNVIDIRIAMEQHTYLLGNAIFAYAASLTPPDHDLMAQGKIVVGYLENLSKEDCVTECDRIRQLATANAVNIVPYGAAAADITDTAALITLYLTGISDPRAAIVTRSNAKKQADLTLNNIMTNLLDLQLDSMANTLRFTNPSWWNQYHLSREIIDLGTNHTKLRATITDQNDNPLQGAAVSLISGQLIIYTSITGTDGKVTISPVKPGTYDLKVEKQNFLNHAETGVAFSPGEEETHDIALLPGNSPSGGTSTIEGNVNMGAVSNADVSHINVNINTTVQVEITLNVLRIYASATAGEAIGSVYWEVPAGTNITKTITEFAALIGADDTKHFVNVYNPGPGTGHFKLTFNNIL